MRLIDANKLYPDCMTKDGKLAISQSQLANAPTVDLKDIYQEGHYDGHLEGYTKAINEERPQGEWGKHGECPFCSYIQKWKEDNFCGNCGANLRNS